MKRIARVNSSNCTKQIYAIVVLNEVVIYGITSSISTSLCIWQNEENTVGTKTIRPDLFFRYRKFYKESK